MKTARSLLILALFAPAAAHAQYFGGIDFMKEPAPGVAPAVPFFLANPTLEDGRVRYGLRLGYRLSVGSCSDRSSIRCTSCRPQAWRWRRDAWVRTLSTSSTDELAARAETFRNSGRRIREQQDELAKREQFLQSLIDAMPDGIRVITPDFTVLKTNKAFCQQMGLSSDQVLGQACYASSHGRTEPCAPTLVTCPLHEIGKNGKPLMCRQTHKRRDGSEAVVEVSAAPLEILSDGTVRKGVVEAIRD